MTCVLVAVLCVLGGVRPAAAEGSEQIDVEVSMPGGSSPGSGGNLPSGGSGSGGGGGGSDGGGASGDGGAPSGPVNPFAGCTFSPFGFGQMVCPEDQNGLDGPAAPSPAPALPSAAQLALNVRETMPVRIPGPSTSPSSASLLTGLRTWFWLDPEAWRPVSVRAELPGIWAEVTATPVSATWTPGDGSAPVVCAGPGRRHPGTRGAATSCGHTYMTAGDYSVAVEVTYEVTWRSSIGESGAQPALTLDTTLDVTVTQRQAVTT